MFPAFVWSNNIRIRSFFIEDVHVYYMLTQGYSPAEYLVCDQTQINMYKQITIGIAQPAISACQENWDKMTPQEKGRFCSNCNKTVHDLSAYSKTQLQEFLLENRNKDVCGRVPSDLFAQPFSFAEHDKTPKLAWFALLIFLIFGMTLFFCHEKEYEAVKRTVYNSMQLADMQKNFRDEVNISTVIPEEEDYKIQLREDNLILPVIHTEDLVSEMQEDTLQGDTLETVVIVSDENRHWLGGMTTTTYLTKTIIYNDEEQETVNDNNTIVENTIIAWPNPAHNTTTIKYNVAENGLVLLSIYSMNGQKITDLISENNKEAGEYTEQFNTADLPAGQYIILLFNNAQKKDFRLTVVH